MSRTVNSPPKDDFFSRFRVDIQPGPDAPVMNGRLSQEPSLPPPVIAQD